MLRTRSIGCLLLSCLLMSGAGSAWSAPEVSELDPGIERGDIPESDTLSGPLAVFAAIEEAWSAEDPEVLVEILDPEEKVIIAFEEGFPRGGYFNRDQAFFLLKDMFAYSRTDRFEFQRFWNLDSDGRSPYAVALREIRMTDGVEHADQVYISLRWRGEAWYIGEIRSINQ